MSDEPTEPESQGPASAEATAGRPIAAPSLDGATEWLNVASPIALSQLRGKVVLLDFWTYGCINCMHILRDLKTLEERFADELVVIGVHSPKFTNERSAENLKRILIRYLFIADSNHNRIVVTSLDGHLIETVGSGFQGDGDGIFTQARFYRPQGLALDPSTSLGAGDLLYVADTENHQVRVIDFQARAVHTIGVPRLNSPWDLALRTGVLIVAMAGAHQIWVIDLLHDQAYPYAGSGEEERRDGAVGQAAFAQPSGLAIDGQTLFVADAESNTVRSVALPPANVVTTLAGGNLFDFGDQDGTGDRARLQHPLGVSLHDGRVLIADTYNHKIKMLDPASGKVTTIAGTGLPGHVDGPASRAQFYEPGGLSVAGHIVYVADTNNHAIRTIDLQSATVSTLTLEGLAPPAAWSYLRQK
jgi:DNA-binding beta-propeller fold protein YncE